MEKSLTKILAQCGLGLMATGALLGMAPPTTPPAPKYPTWLQPRSQLQAVNCGHSHGVEIEALIRYGTAPGRNINCYYKWASATLPDIVFELRVPASGANLEIAVSMLATSNVNKPGQLYRNPAHQSLSCADAPVLGRYLLERHVYDGNLYLPLPKVSACKVEQVAFPAKAPFLTPFGYQLGPNINTKMVERRSIIYSVSLADLTKGLPPHLKRKK